MPSMEEGSSEAAALVPPSTPHLYRHLRWLLSDASAPSPSSGDPAAPHLLRAPLWNEHWKDLVIAVRDGVLIPRPEMKAVVDMVEKLLRRYAVSGDKLLRDVMVENKIELYAAYGKLMNCGSGGSCGTCIVEIIDGKELLSPRTDAENRYLKKKPELWRLTCQTIVGNKENSGKVVVQRLPQWKK